MRLLALSIYLVASLAFGAGQTLTTTADQTITGAKTFSGSCKLLLAGSTSGTSCLKAPAIAGSGTQIVFPDSAGTLALSGANVAYTQITGMGSGVATWLGSPSSANLISAVTDETGTGALVFANTPTLVTPVLGVATATTINKVTLTAPASGSTLTINDGVTLTVSASSTVSGTPGALAAANTWTKAQSVTTSTLTDAANISVDASLSNNFKVTLAGNRTIDNPTNLVNGTTYNFIVIQDSGGSKTLAYGNKYKFAGGAKTISTAANAVDLISCLYESVTDLLYCVLAKAFS